MADAEHSAETAQAERREAETGQGSVTSELILLGIGFVSLLVAIAMVGHGIEKRLIQIIELLERDKR